MIRFNYIVQSSKIMDEFRGDLKVSITKVEDQIRDKVDKFNLDELGRKLDLKFNGEINKKLDKTDLKKNNSFLTKKVSLLLM